MIWRELLFCAIEKKIFKFTQKELSGKLGVSTSTIFQSLKVPRRIGAVEVGGRFFRIEDVQKLLYHWASVRNLQKDIIFEGHVEMSVLKIEGQMPPDVVFGAFSAARQYLSAPPADYDKIYVYAKDASSIKARFEFSPGYKNLFVLRADALLWRYGNKTTLAQTFVDIWNLSDWQAKDFTRAIGEKINGLLS